MKESFPISYGDDARFTAIEPNRRLISWRMAQNDSVREYFDTILSSRIINYPIQDFQVGLHTALGEQRLPVFSSMHENNTEVSLVVPQGSRTLRQSLNVLARDASGYTEVFQQLGTLLRDLHSAGFGQPVTAQKRSVLDSIAFSPEQDSNYGTRLYLIPPYTLDADTSFANTAATIRDELRYSGYFNSETIHHLMLEIGNDSE